MKHFKKAVCILAAASLLTTSLLAGCSKKEEPKKDDNKPAATAELKPVNLLWYVFGAKQPDHDVVMTELNKKLNDKLKVTLDLQVLDAATYQDKMKMIVAASENYDICFTSNWKNNYWENVAKGAFAELDDLIAKNTPNLKKVIPDSILDVAKVKGKTYAIPNIQLMYTAFGFNIQKELLDKYKFDINTIKNYKDIEPFLEIIKKNEPNLIPMRLNFDTTSIENELVGTYCMIKKGDKSLKILPLIGSNAEKENMLIHRDWFNKGYIRKDIVTITDDSADLKANKFAVLTNQTRPDGAAVVSNQYAKEYVSVAFQKPYVQAISGASTMNAISSSSKNPDRALKLIELINTDKEIYNMLIFGIEKTHYNKISNDTVEVPKESKYQMGTSAWVFGNQFNALYMKGQQPGTWEETDKLNKSAEVSVLRGFNFDQAPVQAEMAKLAAVAKEYKNIAFMPDYEKLDAARVEKMKAAGLDKVVAEVQKQVDEWAKAAGKK